MAKIYNAVVSGKRKLSEDTYSIQYNCPEIAGIAKPGNFVMVRPNLPDEGIDPITPRPFGIYTLIEAAGKPLGFSLIVKVMGKGTRAIVNKNVGDLVQINGPLGNEFVIEEGKEYLMAAGGTGIAPVAFAAQEMKKRNISFTILYGGRSVGDVHLDELDEFGIPAKAVTEDGTAGISGLVTKPLKESLISAAVNVEVFACGPWAMMKAASLVCQEAGRKSCWCSLERYMACGFGVCLACVYKKNSDEKYHTCCKEGPIVNGLEVNWDA